MRTFRVESNDSKDGPLSVYTGAATVGGSNLGPDVLPAPYAPYVAGNDQDLTALCRSIEVEREENSTSGGSWLVVCSYDSNLGSQDSQGRDNRSEDPTQWLPEINFSTQTYQRVADKDTSVPKPKALTTTAGEPFDPPAMRDDSRIVLSFTRYEATYPLSVFLDYQDTINSDPFLGAPAKTVKLNGVKAQRAFVKGRQLWRVTYEFSFVRDTWRFQIANVGRMARPAPGKDAIAIPDSTIPRRLKEDGTLAGKNDDDYFVPFDVYQTRTFANLNIVF